MSLTRAISSSIAGVAAFARSIFDVVEGIGGAIRSMYYAIRDIVVGLLPKIPDALLPDSLLGLKNLSLAGTPTTTTAVPASSPLLSGAGIPTASAMPAAVDAAARQDELSRLAANALSGTSRFPEGPAAMPPMTVNVQVDGETVARAVNNAQESNAARAFSPVPAY